jgi:hypothetical protein
VGLVGFSTQNILRSHEKLVQQIDNFVSTTTLHVLNSRPWYPSTSRMAPSPTVLQFKSKLQMVKDMGYNDEAARVMRMMKDYN